MYFRLRYKRVSDTIIYNYSPFLLNNLKLYITIALKYTIRFEKVKRPAVVAVGRNDKTILRLGQDAFHATLPQNNALVPRS